MKGSDKSFSDLLQYRRYGGDLQGVLDKLDYLQDLGINAIYINPINDAPSLTNTMPATIIISTLTSALTPKAI